jgi:hypothetical protein
MDLACFLSSQIFSNLQDDKNIGLPLVVKDIVLMLNVSHHDMSMIEVLYQTPLTPD